MQYFFAKRDQVREYLRSNIVYLVGSGSKCLKKSALDPILNGTDSLHKTAFI